MLCLLFLIWRGIVEKVSSEQGSEQEEYLAPIPWAFPSQRGQCKPYLQFWPHASLWKLTLFFLRRNL